MPSYDNRIISLAEVVIDGNPQVIRANTLKLPPPNPPMSTVVGIYGATRCSFSTSTVEQTEPVTTFNISATTQNRELFENLTSPTSPNHNVSISFNEGGSVAIFVNNNAAISTGDWNFVEKGEVTVTITGDFKLIQASYATVTV